MALRTALIVDGSAQGAVTAAQATSQAVRGMSTDVQAASKSHAAFGQQQDKVVQGSGRANASLYEQRMTFRLLAREAALVGGPLGGMIGQIGALTIGTGRLGGRTTAMVLGLSAVAAVVYKSVAAFSAFETQQAKVAAILDVTKGASGETADSLDAMARRLSASGAQSIVDVRAAQDELLKYKAVGSDVFETVLKAATGAAAGGFADLKGSTVALGRAFSDMRNAAEPLKQVGIDLSASQQQLAADFLAVGNKAAAQQVILRAIAPLLNAESKSADTLGKSWERIKDTAGGVLEYWGGVIAKGLQLKDVLDGINGTLKNGPENAADWALSVGGALQYLNQYNPVGLGNRGAPTQSMRGVSGARPSPEASISPVVTGAQSYLSTSDAAAARQRAADDAAGLKSIDAVTTALKKEAATAGLSAVQLEIYNRTSEAGVNADLARANGLGPLTAGQLKARDAIVGLVNANLALKDTREITDQIKGQADAARIEAATVGMATGAAVAYRTEQEALSRERIKGVALSKEQRDAIAGEAKAYGQVADAAARAKLANELVFDQAQVMRSDADAAVASRLKGAGLPIDLKSTNADIIRGIDAMRDLKSATTDVATSFTHDLTDALRNGQKFFASLGTAGLNALGNIAAKLEDMATKRLVDAAFGSSPVGGLLSALGIVSTVAMTPVAGAAGIIGANGPFVTPTFAAGGYTGNGGRGKVAGLVHGREFVVNADATAQHLPLLQAINDGALPGYAGGGFVGHAPPRLGAGASGGPVINVFPVAGSTMDVRQNSDGSIALVGRMIDDKIAGFDKTLPARVAAINADPRRR